MSYVAENQCAFLGRNFLIAINILTAIAGLMLCAGGAYLWIEYEDQFSELLSTGPIMGVMIAGFVLFVLTMTGIYGAVTGKKTVLLTYLILVVFLIAVEVAASVVFLQYLNFIESSAEAKSSELQEQTEIAINNFIYRSYQTCCVEEPEFCSPAEFSTEPLYCEPVEFCLEGTNNTSVACVMDSSPNPTFHIEIGVCTAFANLESEGFPLVGPAERNNPISCGGGDPLLFEQAVTQWLKDNILFFGYGALGVGIVEILVVVFALGLLLTNPHMVPKARVLEDSEEINYDRISVAIPVSSRTSSRSVRLSNRSVVSAADRASYRSATGDRASYRSGVSTEVLGAGDRSSSRRFEPVDRASSHRSARARGEDRPHSSRSARRSDRHRSERSHRSERTLEAVSTRTGERRSERRSQRPDRSSRADRSSRSDRSSRRPRDSARTTEADL